MFGVIVAVIGSAVMGFVAWVNGWILLTWIFGVVAYCVGSWALAYYLFHNCGGEAALGAAIVMVFAPIALPFMLAMMSLEKLDQALTWCTDAVQHWSAGHAASWIARQLHRSGINVRVTGVDGLAYSRVRVIADVAPEQVAAYRSVYRRAVSRFRWFGWVLRVEAICDRAEPVAPLDASWAAEAGVRHCAYELHDRPCAECGQQRSRGWTFGDEADYRRIYDSFPTPISSCVVSGRRMNFRGELCEACRERFWVLGTSVAYDAQPHWSSPVQEWSVIRALLVAAWNERTGDFLCAEHVGQPMLANTGTCRCGLGTSSGSFQFCTTCARAKGVCQCCERAVPG